MGGKRPILGMEKMAARANGAPKSNSLEELTILTGFGLGSNGTVRQIALLG